MNVNILFFASLREQFNQPKMTLSFESTSVTIHQVWAEASKQMFLPEGIKVSINQAYAHADARVYDGDEVAFFPPVTGG